jgi:DNA-directed RNA polymerase specialized sigma24 family protein
VDDRSDFDRQLADVQGLLMGVAMKVLRDREAAQRAVSEANSRALAHYRTFRPGTNFQGWLVRILLNVIKYGKPTP